MPVHNAMPHLDEAVQSILDQTHREFEFLILDDGSTDGSTELLREWAKRDARIRLIETKLNQGPVGSSNRVIELASHDLIARMDADDISLPGRLEEQLRVMGLFEDLDLIACACDVIDAKGRKVRATDLWRLARKSWFAPFAHGSVLFRRSLFEAVGGYREQCAYWEDQDLFARMLIFGKARIVTIPDPLYRVRYSKVSTRVASNQHTVEAAVDRMYGSVDLLDRGELYEELLASAPESSAIDPRVFIATGSLGLWAGGKPRLVRHFLKDGKIKANFRSLSALVWTAWASLSPATLRAFMRMLVGIRNRMTAQGTLGQPVEWLPPQLANLRHKADQFRCGQ